jgi:hypothetical protein
VQPVSHGQRGDVERRPSRGPNGYVPATGTPASGGTRRMPTTRDTAASTARDWWRTSSTSRGVGSRFKAAARTSVNASTGPNGAELSYSVAPPSEGMCSRSTRSSTEATGTRRAALR